MTNLVKPMLTSLYQLFTEKFSAPIQAWDRYLEFIAADHNPGLFAELTHGFEWLANDKTLSDKIFSVYQPQLLTNERYDYLGEMYGQYFLSEPERDSLIPAYEVVQAEAITTIGNTNDELNILDPNAGTGRRLLASNEIAPNTRYFGVELNERLARIAMTNAFIHKIPAFILMADPNFHEIDISQKFGRHNWQYANKWYNHYDELKPKLADLPSQTSLL